MNVYLVVLNWNGRDFIGECLDSLLEQSYEAKVIVVDNGSVDGSVEYIEQKYPTVHLIKEDYNHGFAGGVNIGIKYAIKNGAEAVGLINNDATTDKEWLRHLVNCLSKNNKAGIVTCKFLMADSNNIIDSTGDIYTIWGLPYPRGRGQKDVGKFNKEEAVFGASGGASLYRIKMLKEIGLFDEKFFAYYEDVDISFRAQLAGWKVRYQPKAVAYHKLSQTSIKISGFTTYQTIKNLPLLFWKNVPTALLAKMVTRYFIAYSAIVISSLAKLRFIPLFKGLFMSVINLPYMFSQRYKIQRTKKISSEELEKILYHDLPPNAHKLRKIRSLFIRPKS